MKVGDLIRFSLTGIQGLVTKITDGFVYVLCGTDADGYPNGEVLAFPESHIKAVVISESR